MSGTYPDNASIQREQGLEFDHREQARRSFDHYAEVRFTCPTCGEPIDGECPECIKEIVDGD